MIPLSLHEGHSHHPSVEGRKALADAIWEHERIELLTVGIDIGSSTSHMIFAKVHLQRLTFDLSSRYEVVKREILWQSSICFTPFLDNGLIDSGELENFIKKAYFDAGLHKHDVDSGAVILTGEAIKKANARSITEIFAKEAGKFVCAVAGHRLECILAAHGSGAVEKSRSLNLTLLHIDIGGGTTKLALIDKGKIVSTAAYAIGGRLMATDASGKWSCCDESIYSVASFLDITFQDVKELSSRQHAQIVKKLAAVLISIISNMPHDSLADSLCLTDRLDWLVNPEKISFSGGVSEYIYGRISHCLGDISHSLSNHLMAALKTSKSVPTLIDLQHGIRATVIGASQFTVQVSGKTIFAEELNFLPLRNIPVVQPEIDFSTENLESAEICQQIERACQMAGIDEKDPLALSFSWQGEPSYKRLRVIAIAIDDAVCQPKRKSALILVVDGDVGRLLGRILGKELGKADYLIALDGIILSDLDFIDVGELISPPGVIPLVIKSLIFDSLQSLKH